MNRKDFLNGVIPLGLGMIPFSKSFAGKLNHSKKNAKLPPYLKKGDTIGITCPAGAMSLDDAQPCINALQAWGFKVKPGNTFSTHWQQYSAPDDVRLVDLQNMLDDDEVDTIIFGRGGYGVMRIMDRINWKKFAKRPKWLIGYSDITALHSHINRHLRIATIHADMANGFDFEPDEASLSLLQAISGHPIRYQFTGNDCNVTGTATGILVGGNLSTLYALQGSKSQLNTAGKILMIEDVGERKYTVDRMIVNLRRSGMLDKLAALAVGGFSRMKSDGDEEYSMTIEDIILEHVKDFGYPVCFNFPAGHQKANLAMKLGINYTLNIGNTTSSISELTT